MADTINIILEYLRRHQFLKAEAVLREEVTTRQRVNGPFPLPSNDDLDLDMTIYLKSMQEKAVEQQHVQDAAPEKPAPDMVKKSGTELKPAQELEQGPEVKDKPHSEVDKFRSLIKLEEPEPLFMEFEVDKLEHPTMMPAGVGSSPPLVMLPPISKSTQFARKTPPARVGDVDNFQTVAEVTSSSCVENKASSQKVVETTSVVTEESTDGTAGVFDSPAHQEKGSSPSPEVPSSQALFEATRGKVDALKQRWEPKSADKPAFGHEKGRVAVVKKVEGHSAKGNDNNGPFTPVQASGRGPLTVGSRGEVDLTSHEETSSSAALPINVIGEESVPADISFTMSNSPEWTNVPIKTIPPIKATMSFTAEFLNRSEDRGREISSMASRHPQGSGRDSEWFRTDAKQELLSQVSVDRESGSQNAGVSQDTSIKHPVEQMREEETTAFVLDSKSTLVPSNLAQEELPKLPPVRLRSIESKTSEGPQAGFSTGIRKNAEGIAPASVAGPVEASPFGLGSYLDVPVGQDVSSSGSRRMSANARPSVSHGITEDQPELLSRFATAGDGQSESALDYPDEYWDSDTYEDDDDPGYHRQPIEDEEWFLAHEIDYPSEDERARPSVENPRGGHHDKEYEKYDDEDRSFVEEEQSYFSGEEYYRTKAGDEGVETQVEVDKVHTNELFGRMDGGENVGTNGQVANATRILDRGEYERQLLKVEGLTLMGGDTRWQGFDSSKRTPSEEGGIKQVIHNGPLDGNTFEVEEDRMGSVRFGGVGVSSDVAEFGSERRDSVRGESSEGDLEIGEIGVRSVGQTSSSSQVANSESGKVLKPENAQNQDEEEEEEDLILKYYNNPWASHKRRGVERESSSGDILHLQNREVGKSILTKLGSNGDVEGPTHKDSDIGGAGGTGFGGFSFPSPSTSGGDIATVSRVDSGKSLWSVRDITGQVLGEEGEEYGNGVLGPDDPLALWRRKSNESSPIISPRNETLRDIALSGRSIGSANSSDDYESGIAKDDEDEEDDEVVEEGAEEEDMLEVDWHIREAEAVAAEDEEAAAVQEQIRRIRAEEDEFETFDLKIVHRKNRTGFEEDKDFPVVINAVIAGRYHVTEYLGSAAFSKAIQAHDLHTGMDVCMKIIKNNKDFFDQSLDEIKLLKYINKHDPGDKHHVLRLYDYFYHREHLFIVCELLRANLYEFHKYNRESGGEVYFTMPRLQSITRQCLEALEFIHGLGLIHCDLKPENILVKSYSRCEVKVIDLGSSCFQTDHLCSYVQSRSYRAPEVILGLPYDQKIDMWSLGCILAELCSGNVLFQNDSLATLLARVVGILGPINPDLLAKGRDTHKFFTKNHMLYERNQDSDQLEYLLPKKTSLSHRLPMGDQGFVDFVGTLLQINPSTRPSATEALKHPWLSYPYEPISS